MLLVPKKGKASICRGMDGHDCLCCFPSGKYATVPSEHKCIDQLKRFVEQLTVSQALYWLMRLAEIKLVVLLVAVRFWVILPTLVPSHPHPILQTIILMH